MDSAPVPSLLPPRLLPVPAFHHELIIKATANGIIVLKDGRFKKRYTGSKYSAVDINGKLYERATDLKKHLAAIDQEGQKKTRKRAAPGPSLVLNTVVMEQQSNDKINLSTKNKFVRGFRVNKMEVRSRILGMINSQRGGRELYFWTVTFPAGTTDGLAYQMFNIWLTTLRQKRMLKDYIWIAERQDGKRITDGKAATNTIHFHLAIPHKMHVVTANRLMRTTLATFAKKNLIPFSVFACKRYNGIDIKKNRNTGRVVNFAIKKGSRALANYLTKYVTKNDTEFQNLAWHNSRGFSALFTGITFTVPEFIKYGFKELLLHRSVISNEFFAFWPWVSGPPVAITSHLYALNSYLQSKNPQ